MMQKSQAEKVLSQLATDYVTSLQNDGHSLAADLVASYANTAMRALTVDEARTPVPGNADVPD